jgi:phosphatidylglycerol:prolipoprotein diacylglycerol transferase
VRPILLEFGPFVIYAYSVCMMTGVTLVGWLGYREAERRGRLNENTLTIGVAGLLGGVLGANVGMIMFLGPRKFIELAPTIPFHGNTLAGALIGGYIAVVIAERVLHVDRCFGDLVAPFMPLGLAIGRLGNFLAGDAYGIPTDLPWGIEMADAVRHPAQLYEMVLDLALFAYLYRRRFVSYQNGELFRTFAVGYALIRFPMEFLRYQPTPVDFLGLTLVQWMAIGTLLWFGYQLTLNRMGKACICDVLPKRSRRKAQAP